MAEVTESGPEVAVMHLRASYDRRIFTDVSFTAAPGAVTVVSGPSGIGKTTLIRVLLGRMGADRGDVLIGGRTLVGASSAQLAELHRHTASLFSGLDAGARGRKGAFPGIPDDPDDGVEAKRSVADNVRDAATDADRARRALADFELTDVADERAGKLDDGDRRRLGLARVFAADPTLVLLDDPVAALGPADRDRVVAALRRARSSCSAGPPTVVLACHDLTTTKALGDTMVTLVSGRVGVSGPVGELLDGIETDHQFAERFAVGGKRIADDSSEALDEHRFSDGLRHFDHRVFVTALAVLGTLFLVAIVLLIALRVAP